MKFTNLNPIGFSQQIEIIWDGYVWDLHNAADFLGYDFNQSSGLLTLSWNYGCECDGIISGKIKFICIGVGKLEISEKDPDVPRSEDSCLDHICLNNENILNIDFRGGQKFVVKCNEVEFDPGETLGHRA